MSISRRGADAKPSTLLMQLWSLVNLAAALIIFLMWPSVGQSLADALSVLTGGGPRGDSSLFSYPNFMLWGLPIAGFVLYYLVRAMDLRPLARFIALFPALMFAASWGWLYYTGYFG